MLRRLEEESVVQERKREGCAARSRFLCCRVAARGARDAEGAQPQASARRSVNPRFAGHSVAFFRLSQWKRYNL